MNIVLWLVVGASIGWVGSLLLGTDSREGLIRNVVFATVGAFIGSWLLGLGSQTNDSSGLTVGAVLASIVGAAALVAVGKRFSST
jgi:uncharacterized membrane protein YeaQ/YmgE (transglycosylase-associated protein family)